MSQAVIIAGGKSTRMRPYTDDRPKAMAEVAGRPIVARQLSWLRGHGVTQVVISVGYRAEVLQDYVQDGARFGLTVSYAVEGEPLGRGGGLRLAAERLPHPNPGFFALNGDVLARFDLGELRRAHEASGAIATIALARYRSSLGVVELDGDRVTGFVQSPVLPPTGSTAASTTPTRPSSSCCPRSATTRTRPFRNWPGKADPAASRSRDTGAASTRSRTSWKPAPSSPRPADRPAAAALLNGKEGQRRRSPSP
jgi:Nucleotidyl transferase